MKMQKRGYISFSNKKAALTFLKQESYKNINMKKKTFKLLMCVGNCAWCIKKITLSRDVIAL